MLKRASLLLFALVVALPLVSRAQTMDADYAARVKEWTTKPEFLSPLVDHLPASSTVPSPRDVLGHHIGAPKQLTYYADVLRYYDTLAAHTPRVKVIRIGKTEEGRDSVIVFVGSEDSIAHLDDNRKNLARLADPRGLTDAEARDLIAKTKPIYTISGGLHSAELGPPEMLMELAYRLATEDSPTIQKIRAEVIVAIMPVADPDGRDRSIDWYFAHNVDVTNYEKMSGVPYWGKYIMHDNNRDINYSGMANQNFLRWYLDWHPQIIHDLHESVPFLYIYSGQAPQNPLWSPAAPTGGSTNRPSSRGSVRLEWADVAADPIGAVTCRYKATRPSCPTASTKPTRATRSPTSRSARKPAATWSVSPSSTRSWAGEGPELMFTPGMVEHARTLERRVLSPHGR